MEGVWPPRWGSLARSGAPDTVCSPETTQELEPRPRLSRTSPTRSTPTGRSSASPRAPEASRTEGDGAGAPVGRRSIPLGDDHRVVLRVCRPELGDPFGRNPLREHCSLQFGDDVGSQVPGHHLGEGQCVGGLPGRRPVVGVLDSQEGVLQADSPLPTVGQVGVDTLCVGVQHALHPGRQRLVFAGRHLFPSQGSQEDVGLHLGLAEHLGGAPAGHVPVEVHLPETVLGFHETLRHSQVREGGCVDVRCAVAVPDHGGLGAEAG